MSLSSDFLAARDKSNHMVESLLDHHPIIGILAVIIGLTGLLMTAARVLLMS
jgi:hypothetical protein